MLRDRRALFLIVLYSVIIAVGGYAVYRTWSTSSAMASLPHAVLGEFQGPAESQKVVVEFLDYRCSFCRTIDPVMKDFMARNPDVKVVYRHYPVFGKPSVIEAEVALAAAMQGKFAEAHDYLMSRGEQPISEAEIDELAMRLGLDMQKFRTDMKGPEIGYLLLNTMDVVEAIGVSSTPTLVVGEIIYPMTEGMLTVEKLEQLVAQVYGR